MSYKNIEIKSSYETGKDELLESFYIPVLDNTVKYDRIAGFFSSSSLAVSAKGIYGLIKNKGKMRMICSPKMNENDIEIIKKILKNDEEILNELLSREIEFIEDDLENDHVKALGWMLYHNFLEIKIVVPNCIDINNNAIKGWSDLGIFHQKVGILEDSDGNKISFSGSINESAAGWLFNIEEFKVFKSWENSQNIYLQSDISKFDEIWNDKRHGLKTYELPKAIKQKIIDKSKTFDLSDINIKKYRKYKEYKSIEENLSLFNYQREAVHLWEENGHKLLFEMATGTGKTRTAIACITKLLRDIDRFVIIVSCPQGTLSLQWKNEIEKLNLDLEESLVIDGTNRNWKADLENALLKLYIGYYKNCIVYTTHTTCSKEKFINIIKENSKRIKILFVGDEVHGLGASKMKKGLLEEYDYRVGLSATPERWFDESGTGIIKEYFGNNSFKFTITDALNTINPLTGRTFLVNYYYFIEFIKLTDCELEEYMKLSYDITKLYNCRKKSEKYQERRERLLFKRANIVKNAKNKYSKLKEILLNMDDIEDTIIFVSPEQIDTVIRLLGELGISCQKITQEQGTTPSIKYQGMTERQFIIDNFKNKVFKVLVAIKCLDEGIDIPSAKNAILMANSTNPREYVQRIGRVIRQNKDKCIATIYDISIASCYNRISDENLRKFEKSICKKERVRLEEISRNSINNAEGLIKIQENMGD